VNTIITTKYSNYTENAILLDEPKHATKKLHNNNYIIKLQQVGLYQRADKVLHCSCQLIFSLQEHIMTLERRKRLKRADFCKDRFCSYCNWRRALNISSQLQEALEAIKTDKQIEILFLTLTVQNPPVHKLKETVQRMNKAFRRLTQQKPFKRAILGWFRALEILGDKTQDGEVHPHFHCLLIVNRSYFTSRDYIKQSEWTEMWKKALKVDYTPIVNIKRIKPKNNRTTDTRSAAKETAKYSVKHTELTKRTDDDFYTILQQTTNMRFYASGGILKEYLNLQKAEDQLIDSEQKEPFWYEIAELIYSWTNGDYRLKTTVE